MSHLNLETIARLVEDEPDGIEAAHLASCSECRTQLDAMIEDVHALAMLPDMAAAPDNWDALERRLTGEGLIRPAAHGFNGTARMMQIAAALVLFLGGAMAGRMTAEEVGPATMAVVPDSRPDRNVGDAPQSVATARADGTPQDMSAQSPEQARADMAREGMSREGLSQEGVAPAGLAPAGVTPQDVRLPEPRRDMTFASNGGTNRQGPRSMAEATEFLRSTEALYLEALTRYAELASQAESGDPVARLAALQSIIMTTQAALNETPTDPVINGYHLTALAQRDATLRQVALAGQPIY